MKFTKVNVPVHSASEVGLGLFYAFLSSVVLCPQALDVLNLLLDSHNAITTSVFY